MPPDLVKLMVAEVDVAVPAGPGVEAGMVVLSEVDPPGRRLRIVIAKPEARAIQSAWTGAIPTRPSTWDLYVSTVALLEARVDRVIITAVEEDRHFFASLEMEKGGERRVLACRPSDAIALALRAYGAEIFCLPAVVDAAGLNADGTKYGPWAWPEPAPVAVEEPAPPGGTVGSPPAGALPGSPAVTTGAPAPAAPRPKKAAAKKATAKKATPAKKRAAVKEAAPTKELAPAKELASAKKRAAAKKAVPAKKTGTAKKAVPAKKAPAKKAVPQEEPGGPSPT